MVSEKTMYFWLVKIVDELWPPFTGPEDARKVIVKSISLVVEDRPDATLDLTGIVLSVNTPLPLYKMV